MYKAQKFDHLLGLTGFSDDALNTHFTLYEGYVANANKLIDIFSEQRKSGGVGSSEFAELKRRFGWEFNGMRLHELYFGAMTKDAKPLDEESKLAKKLIEAYGSVDAWRQDFQATGAMRGIGWAILAYDKEADKVFNIWVNEHDLGHLAGAVPLLPMDVFEHAFLIDYGLKRVEYIDAFMNAVDWQVVESRMK
jgi:Fe-Mn family superoxide dismutase